MNSENWAISICQYFSAVDTQVVTVQVSCYSLLHHVPVMIVPALAADRCVFCACWPAMCYPTTTSRLRLAQWNLGRLDTPWRQYSLLLSVGADCCSSPCSSQQRNWLLTWVYRISGWGLAGIGMSLGYSVVSAVSFCDTRNAAGCIRPTTITMA